MIICIKDKKTNKFVIKSDGVSSNYNCRELRFVKPIQELKNHIRHIPTTNIKVIVYDKEVFTSQILRSLTGIIRKMKLKELNDDIIKVLQKEKSKLIKDYNEKYEKEVSKDRKTNLKPYKKTVISLMDNSGNLYTLYDNNDFSKIEHYLLIGPGTQFSKGYIDYLNRNNIDVNPEKIIDELFDILYEDTIKSINTRSKAYKL